jgi:hypothetical protein
MAELPVPSEGILLTHRRGKRQLRVNPPSAAMFAPVM